MSESPTKSRAIEEIEREIDENPYYSALYETESGRNPKAKNPISSASGAFQFVKKTAASLGLDDPFDLEKSFQAVKKLTEPHLQEFGDDPAMLYSAHFLGATTLRKWLNDEPLTKQQQKHVLELQTKALPRFLKIYKRVVSGSGSLGEA